MGNDPITITKDDLIPRGDPAGKSDVFEPERLYSRGATPKIVNDNVLYHSLFRDLRKPGEKANKAAN